MRDGDYSSPDDEGIELPALDLAWTEAIRTSAEMARDHQLAIKVRDDNGFVLAVTVTFEAEAVNSGLTLSQANAPGVRRRFPRV